MDLLRKSLHSRRNGLIGLIATGALLAGAVATAPAQAAPAAPAAKSDTGKANSKHANDNFRSPLGVKQDALRQKALENRKGGLGLADDVSKVAVAVGMDFHSMQERWKVGLVQLRRDVPVKLDALAAREGGYVETIAVRMR